MTYFVITDHLEVLFVVVCDEPRKLSAGFFLSVNVLSFCLHFCRDFKCARDPSRYHVF